MKLTIVLGVLMAVAAAPLVAADEPVAPLPPSSVNATPADTGILVEWTPPAFGESEVAYYVVYRDGVAVAQVAGTSFVDAAGDQSSVYAVAAANSGGESAPALAFPPWMGVCIHWLPGEIPPFIIDPLACLGMDVLGRQTNVLNGPHLPSVALEFGLLPE